jgi:hypothetical protein
MSGAAQHRPDVTTSATAGLWRLARGTAVGGVASVLALAGHVLGGGTPAPVPALLLLSGTVAVSVALSARRWTTGSLLGLLLSLQAVAHVAFAHAGHAVPVAGDAHSAAGHTAGLVASGHAHAGAGMLTAHVTAAVLTALLLRRCEHWCWRLLELAAGVLRALRLLGVRVRSGWEPVALTGGRVDALRAAALDLAHPRRGPPAAPAR